MRIITNPDNFKEGKFDLCAKVADFLGNDYKPTHIVLDNNSYEQNKNILDEFRDIAFAWTPDRPRENVPIYLRNIMDDPKCNCLVWISKKALAFDDALFAWVIAHELRHVYQSRKEYPVKCIKDRIKKLRKEQHYKNLPSSLLNASEIDAEVCGLTTIMEIFGREKAIEFLSAGSLRRCPSESYAKALQDVAKECY